MYQFPCICVCLREQVTTHMSMNTDLMNRLRGAEGQAHLFAQSVSIN